MEKSIEDIVREIVKEELATALKEKITLQIQYADSQEEKAADSSNSETNEDNLNQAIQ